MKLRYARLNSFDPSVIAGLRMDTDRLLAEFIFLTDRRRVP
jgi:hypothetical protein